jgi:glycosyltransferase involved in cell wall biosynthesis
MDRDTSLFTVASLLRGWRFEGRPLHRKVKREYGGGGKIGMHVTFWADMLYYRIAGGTTQYSTRLAEALSQVPDINLRLLSLYRPEVIARLAQERQCPAAESVPSRLPRQLHYLLWLTGWAGRSAAMTDDADVVHVPWLAAPPHGRAPLVVTAHDLVLLRFPEYLNRKTRWMARMGLRQAIRESKAFIAVSYSTANDLIRLAGIRKERVYVVPEAADGYFRPVPASQVRERYKVEGPFLLYVGTLEPRKNLTGLVRAFAALDIPGLKLVIVGKKGWMYRELFETVKALALRSRVVFTGFVPASDLPALFSAAEVFVYPSLYEGFGLPVLEAMQCGAPVITTNVSSLPEVAGEAALLVAPDDVRGLTGAIRRVLAEPGLREELRGKGFEQSRRFSWSKTADLTAEVYRQACR